VLRNNLYELGSTARYYRVRVVIGGNAHPVGTKVVVHFGPYRQVQEVLPTLGFGTSPYPDLHFGVGRYLVVKVDIYAQALAWRSHPHARYPSARHRVSLAISMSSRST
jgi:hypothetical protein